MSTNGIALTKSAPIGVSGTNLDRLAAIGVKMDALCGQLAEIFPEREDLINQIKYALVTRENVLIYGPYGTGKSDLIKAVFDAFTGARQLSIQLTKFMTESHIIGVPDAKLMREEGMLKYRREGGILDGDLIELDEIFDANGPVLRTLLRILNEREFVRGPQKENANLHTALASTNGDPAAVIKSSPELGAVADRFIFWNTVDYLQKPESRRAMYRKFANNVSPDIKLNFQDLQYVASVVEGDGIPLEDWVLDGYAALIEEYRKAIGQTKLISDRRANKLLKLVRASATLNGRMEVDPEDLRAVRWGLCLGGNPAEHTKFEQCAEVVIKQIKDQRQQNLDQLSASLLTQYETAFKAIPSAPSDDTQLLECIGKINSLQEQVINMGSPTQPSNKDRQKKLLDDISVRSNELFKRIGKQQVKP